MKIIFGMDISKLISLRCYFGFLVDHLVLFHARICQVIVQVVFHYAVVRVVHEVGEGRRGCVERFVEL